MRQVDQFAQPYQQAGDHDPIPRRVDVKFGLQRGDRGPKPVGRLPLMAVGSDPASQIVEQKRKLRRQGLQSAPESCDAIADRCQHRQQHQHV